MDDRTRVILMLDAYGSLLPETQREAVRMAYEEDLSLAEIAAQSDVSRQAAHWAVRRGVEQLKRYEDAVGCIRREKAWREGIGRTLALPEDSLKTALNALLENMEDDHGV